MKARANEKAEQSSFRVKEALTRGTASQKVSFWHMLLRLSFKFARGMKSGAPFDSSLFVSARTPYESAGLIESNTEPSEV